MYNFHLIISQGQISHSPSYDYTAPFMIKIHAISDQNLRFLVIVINNIAEQMITYSDNDTVRC